MPGITDDQGQTGETAQLGMSKLTDVHLCLEADFAFWLFRSLNRPESRFVFHNVVLQSSNHSLHMAGATLTKMESSFLEATGTSFRSIFAPQNNTKDFKKSLWERKRITQRK